MRFPVADGPGYDDEDLRRMDMLRAMAAAAISSYDFTLTANNDDGRETVGGTWGGTFTLDVIDNDANGVGTDTGDNLVGLSFPNVTLTSCSSATLFLIGSTETVAGTLKVQGESQAVAASAQWATGNRPSNATYVASEGSITTATGTKSLDVTTMVQQIMAGAAWASGNRINFMITANSVSAQCTFTSTGTTKPRLQIVSR